MRIATVVVGIPFYLGALYLGGWLLLALVAALAAIGYGEYRRMWQRLGITAAWAPGLLAVLAFLLWAQAQVVAAAGGAAWAEPFLAIGSGGVMTGAVLGAMGWQVLAHRRQSPTDTLVTCVGALYSGWLFAHLLLLRGLPGSPAWLPPLLIGRSWPPGFLLVMLTLVTTWAVDTGAYFVGVSLRGPKLAPALSPGKTVSGAVGGTLAGMGVAGWLASAIGLPVGWGAAFGLVIAVAGQIGDLAESAIKRHTGVKDSGALLPGHGGVLDRFDSTLFTVPAAYYLALLWLGR